MRGRDGLPRRGTGRDVTDEKPTGPRPGVFARLRADSDEQWQPHAAPRWARPIGIALVLAIVGLVVVATRLG